MSWYRPIGKGVGGHKPHRNLGSYARLRGSWFMLEQAQKRQAEMERRKREEREKQG